LEVGTQEGWEVRSRTIHLTSSSPLYPNRSSIIYPRPPDTPRLCHLPPDSLPSPLPDLPLGSLAPCVCASNLCLRLRSTRPSVPSPQDRRERCVCGDRACAGPFHLAHALIMPCTHQADAERAHVDVKGVCLHARCMPSPPCVQPMHHSGPPMQCPVLFHSACTQTMRADHAPLQAHRCIAPSPPPVHAGHFAHDASTLPPGLEGPGAQAWAGNQARREAAGTGDNFLDG
jgi:hypothetical protein